MEESERPGEFKVTDKRRFTTEGLAKEDLGALKRSLCSKRRVGNLPRRSNHEPGGRRLKLRGRSIFQLLF